MDSKTRRLDDVAVLPPEKNLELSLSEVGLENMQTQVRVQGLLLPAKADASVSLVDKKSRGIHMSRLFRIMTELHEQELSWTGLKEAADRMLSSHEGLSDRAALELRFELPVLRKALSSGTEGWRNYPLTYRVRANGNSRQLEFETRVLYSSTCPCSAGLSRQAIQEDFRREFGEGQVNSDKVFEWLGRPEGVGAVPHAQRSEAVGTFVFASDGPFLSPITLIDAMEQALGTPVQTAVKREDEREFARLNARHLMFCEDAARKLKWAFMERAELADFRFEVRHFESLHPHDVVAKVGKFD